MQLLRPNEGSSINVGSKSAVPETPTKQNTLRESTAVRPSESAVHRTLASTIEAAPTPSGLMQLPPELTQRNVFFSINGAPGLERMYREANEKQWMKFFRTTLLLVAVCKPVQIMYWANTLLERRQFESVNFLFVLNICITMPVCVCFVLFTFTDMFFKFRQLSSMALVLLIAAIWNIESSIVLQSRGYALISPIVLYQCYFYMLACVLRCVAALLILIMYLVCNIFLSNWIAEASPAAEVQLYMRNAFYIALFFVPQMWVVFTSEFNQRINHFRDLVLHAQQAKLLEEQNRVDKLLRNLLPESIVIQLKTTPEATVPTSSAPSLATGKLVGLVCLDCRDV